MIVRRRLEGDFNVKNRTRQNLRGQNVLDEQTANERLQRQACAWCAWEREGRCGGNRSGSGRWDCRGWQQLRPAIFTVYFEESGFVPGALGSSGGF